MSKGTCADCGGVMTRSTQSLPQGQARCQPCRRARTGGKSRKTPCLDCGAPSIGLRCKPCDNKTRIIRHPDDAKLQRHQRENCAPGLNSTQRTKLLHKWIKQDRACAYCPSPATTVDHLLALVRGGTNHEGNLVPACRECNGRKSCRTVMEWRLGKQAPRMVTALGWTPTPVRKPAPPKSSRVYFIECKACEVLFSSRRQKAKYCKAHQYGKRRTPIDGECKTCGRPTISTTNPRIYCSRECRRRDPVVRDAKRNARRLRRRTPAGQAARRAERMRREARDRVSI